MASGSTDFLLESAEVIRYHALRSEVIGDGGSQLSGYDWEFVEQFEAQHNIKHLGDESWEDSATKTESGQTAVL